MNLRNSRNGNRDSMHNRLSENAALEHCGIRAARCVAHFAVADKPLVGVKFKERATLRCAVDVGKAHIGDLKRRWIDFVDVHFSKE